MKRRAVFVFFLLFSFAFLLFPREEKVSDKEKLRRIKEEIKRLKARYEAALSEEKSILGELERLGVAVELRRAELDRLEVELRINRERQREVRRRITKLRKKIDDEKKLLGRKLVFIYKLGRLSYLRMALSMEEAGGFREGYYYLSFLARRDRELIDRFRQDIALFTRSKRELKEGERRLLALRRETAAKAEEVRKLRREKEAYLAKVRREQKLTLQAISELMEASRKLEGLVADLSTEGVPPSPPLPFYRFKGLLSWPVLGKVVATFGKVKHPKFNIYLVRKGIDIAAPPGSPVYAVFDGKVIYADWFRGYGNLLIIDHGDKYWTFYGYASKLLVKVGDYVRKGEPVALVGDTGFLSGPSLHFELRHNGVPENPLDWLKPIKERK